jgi:hypothetical protein
LGGLTLALYGICLKGNINWVFVATVLVVTRLALVLLNSFIAEILDNLIGIVGKEHSVVKVVVNLVLATDSTIYNTSGSVIRKVATIIHSRRA